MRDRIVVGVDGSPGAPTALAWAVCLGEALGAEVVAVHAVGLLETEHPAGQPADAWRAGLLDLTDHRWCARLVDARLAHRIEVVDGPAVDVLLDAAEREHAALMVVGARGVGSRPELALGSTSLRLLQAARIPTLVGGIREDGIAVEVVVRSGDPAATLLQVADDTDADLLVVGSRGGGDRADPLLGSVARTVAARGRRPEPRGLCTGRRPPWPPTNGTDQ
jgi:nucleotide-binding universal stress UspA family protein